MRTNQREMMIYHNSKSNSDRNMVAHPKRMVISNNLDLIKTPITVRGHNAVVCNSPTDINKLTAPNL